MESQTLISQSLAIVDFHLDGGYTRLLFNYGRSHREVPTRAIPPRFRRIGTPFLLSLEEIEPRPPGDPDAIRASIERSIRCEEPSPPMNAQDLRSYWVDSLALANPLG